MKLEANGGHTVRMTPAALWGYGFRPFFLGAGALAALFIPWWVAALAWRLPLTSAWPPALWHGHEMLFGFIGAAIAGFLLTAVPSWTGERGFAGSPLAALAALWALGRVVVATSGAWPRTWVVGIEAAFLPGLIALIAPSLIRTRNRNTPLLAVVAALWIVDLAFHWAVWHGDVTLARHALFVGIDIVLLLVTAVGGRIIPAFTSAALRQHGTSRPLYSWRTVTPLAIGAMAAVTLVDLLSPGSALAGGVAALAAIIQGIRLAQWQGLRTVRMPIVWVLHLGYLWLVLGLALKALALLAHIGFASFYLHALTIGAAGTTIVAVMTRAALGHTGRPLRVTHSIIWAYGLLTAATATRVFGPALLPMAYPQVVLLAGGLWTAALVLFLKVYAPMLLSPRADGKPG